MAIKVETLMEDDDIEWLGADGWIHQVIENDGKNAVILCVCDDEDTAKRIKEALEKAAA